MVLRTQIGQKAGPYSEDVTEELISAFRKAVGAEPSTQLPPTYFSRLRRGEFDLFQRLEINLSKVLHAEQEYQSEAAVVAGDRLTYGTTIIQALDKQGSSGSIHFVTLETKIYAERQGRTFLASTGKTTVVIR